MQEIRKNNGNSGYSNHILNTGHTYGTISVKMDIIKTEKERKAFKHIRKIPHIKNR
jgi:hypothetical protein